MKTADYQGKEGDPSPLAHAGIERTNPPIKKRLLLADDSPQIRAALSKLLRNAGYHVTPLANGNQVLDQVLQGDYDLALLDLNVCSMDGWQTIGQLARLRSKIPIILITAQAGQREWAEAEGIRAVMEKPLDLPELLRTISDLTVSHTAQTISPQTDKISFRVAAEDRPEFSFSEPQRRWGRG